MRAIRATVLASCLLAPLSCSKEPAPAREGETPAKTPVVYTVNYPLAYFAERIGGERVKVVLPVPGDQDPAYWMPDAETVASYQGAALILLNGAGYARWITRVSLPESRLVDTSVSFTDRLISVDGAVTHSHGPGGEHEHGDIAFTTWLDPTLAIEQVDAIRAALARKWPAGVPAFDQGFEELRADLRALDQDLERLLADAPATPLLFSHPVYQYLAHRYGLSARSVHWEPGEAPSPSMWRELDELLGEHPARWMIWEAEPRPDTAEKLEERGLRSVVFAPCGNVPDDGDYLAMMRRNVAALEEVFR